ncbi:MAG: ExeM/NucH family extracellular endonuclease [Cyanobacteria bacterium P01_F01_bin.150]
MATILSAGDIAIVGFNFDNPDELAFVPLVDIASGTEISFTDNGWQATGSFRATEGTFTWIAPTDIAAGTVVNPTVSGVAFSASGDQILAYQGDASNPTFIYALNSEGPGAWQADATSSNTSALPTGLVNTETAVALNEIDNAIYTGITSGTTAELLTAISDSANWSGDNSNRQTMPTASFTVTDAGGNGGGTTLAIAPDTTVQAEGNSGTTPFTFTVTRSGDTSGATSVSYAVSGDADAADFGGTLPSGTVNFADGETTQTITLDVSADTDSEPDEDFTVTISNPTNGATLTAAAADGTILNDDGVALTLISEVQGSGDASPLVGDEVTIEAVVVGDFQDGAAGTNGDLNGFFVQEETADTDADPLTSEGLFIFDGSSPSVDVNIGDVVQITGTVSEFFNQTQITASSVVIQSGSATIVPTNIDLPTVSTTTDDEGELLADLEAYEGMLVTFGDTLTVDEYFNYDRFGEIRLTEGDRPYQFTQTNDPSQAGFQAHLEDLAKRSIVLDDGFTTQNPEDLPYPAPGFADNNAFRGGDTVTGLTGVLNYSFDQYRVQPTQDPVFISQNPRPSGPDDVGGRLTVASFNVLNYFTTLDEGGNTSGPNNLGPRGADSQAEFDRQQQKLVTAIAELDADILGLVELENTDIVGGEDVVLENLVNAINARLGSTVYDYVPTGFIGGDAIKVGYIYKTATAQPSGDFAVLDSSVDPTFVDDRNRPALAQTFEEVATGEKLTLAVNHFKSKGPSGLSNTADPNFDQGDGQGFWNAVRTDAATALTNWLATDPTNSGDSDFLILGDLNAYANEDPIKAIEAAGYTDLAEAFANGEVPYSFLFDGQLGTLDYGLANESLLSQVTGVTEWHVNADEPDALDYNLDFGRDPSLFNGNNEFRNSDHDPLLIGLNLESEPTFDPFFFSGTKDKTVDGLTFGSEDIVFFDGEAFSIAFDGSDVLPRRTALSAFDVISDTEILMSFTKPVKLDGLGRVDDSDVVKFIADAPDTLGSVTSGRFEMFVDGSDVALNRSSEDIDALNLLPNGDLLISTIGNAKLVGNINAKAQDIIRFSLTSTGVNTTATASLEFDGSDVNLKARGENLDAIAFQGDDLLFSTTGRWVSGAESGRREDAALFTGTFGSNTSGSFADDLFFDGSTFGFNGNLTGLDVSVNNAPGSIA